MAAVPLPPEIRRDIPQGASACDSTQRCCNRPSLVAVLPPLLGSPAPPSRTCMCMFASLSHPPTHPPTTHPPSLPGHVSGAAPAAGAEAAAGGAQAAGQRRRGQRQRVGCARAPACWAVLGCSCGAGNTTAVAVHTHLVTVVCFGLMTANICPLCRPGGPACLHCASSALLHSHSPTHAPVGCSRSADLEDESAESDLDDDEDEVDEAYLR